MFVLVRRVSCLTFPKPQDCCKTFIARFTPSS
jgi:hypothetical protein